MSSFHSDIDYTKKQMNYRRIKQSDAMDCGRTKEFHVRCSVM